ncbi:MAG: hypothetical protein NTZ12_03925 [Candidatus Aminicenantes bacterium]|nr:hypothetical protein [Candidatus Aminicenantes bacterium]
MKKTAGIPVLCLLFSLLLSFFSLLAASSTGTTSAETLTYREVEGDLAVTHTLAITPVAPGYAVELASLGSDGRAVRQTFRTAADLSTLAWTFSDPARQMELAAAVQGDEIVLSGSFNGKKVDKRFPASGAPWNQLFQMGLVPFALSGEESRQFRSIGTQGPGELKIGKFTVTRKDWEKILLAGKEVETIHLRISLSGLLSIFWHGDYWFRKNDGRFLRYRGKNRPGGPVAVSELLQEKANEN